MLHEALHAQFLKPGKMWLFFFVCFVFFSESKCRGMMACFVVNSHMELFKDSVVNSWTM